MGEDPHVSEWKENVSMGESTSNNLNNHEEEYYVVISNASHTPIADFLRSRVAIVYEIFLL